MFSLWLLYHSISIFSCLLRRDFLISYRGQSSISRVSSVPLGSLIRKAYDPKIKGREKITQKCFQTAFILPSCRSISSNRPTFGFLSSWINVFFTVPYLTRILIKKKSWENSVQTFPILYPWSASVLIMLISRFFDWNSSFQKCVTIQQSNTMHKQLR